MTHFEEWLIKVRQLYAKWYALVDVKIFEDAKWREFYEANMTPEEAYDDYEQQI